MESIEWIVLGALLLAIMIFCARITRKGISTLDDDRRKNAERIALGEQQLKEDKKNMSAHEHLSIVQSALEDLARLDGKDYEVRRHGSKIEFLTPEGVYAIELVMRERLLKSTHKVLHGRNLWQLTGKGICENHAELSLLMASLQAHRRGEDKEEGPPEHISRRLASHKNMAAPKQSKKSSRHYAS